MRLNVYLCVAAELEELLIPVVTLNNGYVLLKLRCTVTRYTGSPEAF